MSAQMKVLKSREEWLQARSKTIGGSDASSVVGRNPYKDNVTLWMEKTGRKAPDDISDKDYVRYGTEAESSLRKLFSLDFPEYKVLYRKNNLWTNDRYPWAHASADGWLIDKDGRLGILEIKTTNILQSMQKEKWNDRIPDNYYCQLIHSFAVMEAEFAILKAQLKSVFNGEVYLQTKHYFIERKDVEDDIEYLMNAEWKFYRHILNDTRPPLQLPSI